MGVVFLIFLLTIPVAFITAELIFFFKTRRNPKLHKFGMAVDLIGFIVIVYLVVALYDFSEVMIDAPYTEQLYNDQSHAPIAPDYQWFLWVIFGLSVLSYAILNVIKNRRVPPLIPLLTISMMEMGFLFSVVFAIQHTTGENYAMLKPVLPPLLIWHIPAFYGLAFARTVLLAIRAQNNLRSSEPVEKGGKLAAFLERTALWPAVSFLLIWPILGILSGVSMLVSQVPDAAIRAFTDTADWVLSTKIPPQQAYYDEHYLCTVAAGGHAKLVKPLRKGIRHGHTIVVNRQLEIANAFEQILEERTPRFHKAVRTFYDRYGFPLSKLIRTKFAADVVYILMKPLEWIFLFVLYVSDVHPENRIALQYTGGLYPGKENQKQL